MYNGFCDVGAMGFLGDFSLWSSKGLILHLVFWVGLIAVLTLLVVLAIRRGLVHGATASGQTTAKENLQAQYARGEITREQYELKKQNVG